MTVEQDVLEGGREGGKASLGGVNSSSASSFGFQQWRASDPPAARD